LADCFVIHVQNLLDADIYQLVDANHPQYCALLS